MERLKVLVTLRDGAMLPEYATTFASGMDLFAFIEEPVTIRPMERVLIPTGIRIGIPEGYEAEIRPRSGLAYRYGITVLNTPGTIDSDYRGEVKVLLINLGEEPYTVKKGDRIAQIIFKQTLSVEWSITENLPDTIRGEGGFGSTGVEGKREV
ncbi:MAG: dUTP diphosphatase [Syntrophorhabdaceae bacterium]|nr:dUTP diphosphatase [Syntrophorhabdaceae bacterium]